MPTLYLKDQLKGDDTIYPELLTVGVVCWNKLSVYWQRNDMKNSPLTISNYLVKHNGVTMIYTIYKYTEIVPLFFVFERQANEVSGWCSLSMLLSFSESEVFAGETLALGEISFLILLSSIWASDIFAFLTLKTSIFIEEQIFPIK